MSYGVLTSLYKDPSPSSALTAHLAKLSAARGHGESAGALLQAWAAGRTGGIVVTTTSKASRAREYVASAQSGHELSEEELRGIEEATKADDLNKFKYYMTNVSGRRG